MHYVSMGKLYTCIYTISHPSSLWVVAMPKEKGGIM